MEYIAFDAHKHYTLASVATPDGQLVRDGSSMSTAQSAVFSSAASGDRPWRSRRSAAGIGSSMRSRPRTCLPKLVHARKAKLMMGGDQQDR